MVEQNNTTSLEVNKVKIEFTDKEITAYGGFSLLAKFFDAIRLRENIEGAVPVNELSPNTLGIYAKFIGFILIIFAGGDRFSHLLYLGSKNVLAKLFGIKRLPAASTTLTRLFNKIKTMALAEKLSQSLWEYQKSIIPWNVIKEDWLTFDSTVIERYGNQEGAKIGYNPNKRGRPCYNPLIAFLNKSKYVVHFWNRSGNVISCNNIHDFFTTTLVKIQDKIEILGVIADSGFYERLFIEMLEKADKTYVIAARLYQNLQGKVYSIKNWQAVGEGIDIAEFYFKHSGWYKERRYVVIRQDIRIREKATGKQMMLFKEEVKRYRYSLWITNSPDDAYTVWNLCKPRANDENTIKELKEDFALAGFSMEKFYANESAMLIRVLIYNLFVFFRTLVMRQKEKIERLKTLRYKYFILPSHFGRHGKDFILRISLKTKVIKENLIRLFCNINQLVPAYIPNCNAVGNSVNSESEMTG